MSRSVGRSILCTILVMAGWFLRVVFVVLCLYAVIFSLAATWVVWKVHQEATGLMNQVRVLQGDAPVRSPFMDRWEADSGRKVAWSWLPLDSMGPHLPRAVIAAEDADFRFHPGIDIRAILEALDANRARGRTVFGGSTITQQLAKNLFLTPDRNWERKARELGYTILLERELTKDRILELYLNLAQWGDGLHGAAAACSMWFQKPCSRLSLDQAVSLAATLASPVRHNPHTGGRFMAERRTMIWNNLGLGRADSAVTDSVLKADSSKAPTETFPIHTEPAKGASSPLPTPSGL